MEWAEEMGFTSFELRFLNHCCLYLNVISVSDIANESGNNLDTSIMKYKYLPGEKINSQVNQSKPDHTKWSVRFKFTARITRRNQLSLGDWIVDYGQIPKAYIRYHTSTHIYKCKKDRIQTWSILNTAGIEWTRMMKEEVNSIPEEAIPRL